MRTVPSLQVLTNSTLFSEKADVTTAESHFSSEFRISAHAQNRKHVDAADRLTGERAVRCAASCHQYLTRKWQYHLTANVDDKGVYFEHG